MIKLKKIGNAIWAFLVLMSEARAKRDVMTREAIIKHGLGR